MRRITGAVGALLFVLAVALTFAVRVPQAAAHAKLLASVPTANAVLEEPPTRIFLDFDEDIETAVASIRLYDQRGAELAVGPVQAAGDATTVAADVRGLGSGTYAVVWRVASADGHVIDGAFAFQVGTGQTVDGAELIDRVRDGATVDAGVSRLAGVLRWLSMLSSIVVVGGGWWLAAAVGPGAASRRSWRVLWIAAVMSVVAAVGTLVWFGVRVRAGTVTDGLRGVGLGDALSSRTGQLYAVRAVTGAVWVVLLRSVAQRAATWWRIVGVVSGVVALITFPASGHPNAAHPPSLWIAVDFVHLGAVALWIGGLVLFALGGAVWFGPEEPTVRRFSRVATWAVPAVVLTGAAQTLKLVGTSGLGDLSASAWGRYLVTKLVLVVIVVTIGAVSRWALQHAGAGSIRRSVAVEALLSVGVVALAAGLVAVPPMAGPPSRPFTAALTQGDLIVDVSIGPGQVGANEIHVVITPPGGSLAPVEGVQARASLDAQSIPNSPVTLQRLGPNHYSGSWVVPAAGDWRLQLIVETTPGSSVQVSATVPIPG